MIIDGHAHACGGFLTADGIVKILDANQVDKVLLTAGEPNSTKIYNLPNLAGWFPNRDVIAWINALSKLILRVSGTARHLYQGNAYVYGLVRQAPDRILQVYWVQLSTWSGTQGLPIFLHMDRKLDVQVLIEYIRTHPQITFIIAHLFALEAYIQAGLRVDKICP